jgi:hypothetical protein
LQEAALAIDELTIDYCWVFMGSPNVWMVYFLENPIYKMGDLGYT